MSDVPASISLLPRWWQRYFFPEAGATNLAAIRMVLISLHLGWFVIPLADHRLYLTADAFIDPPALLRGLMWIVPESVLRTPLVIETMWWTMAATGLLSLVGLFTRLAMPIYAALNLLLICHKYAYGSVHHPDALFSMALLFIAFSPCNRCLSLDSWRHRRREPDTRRWGPYARFTTTTWAIRLMQWLIAIMYVQAFASKWHASGLYWMNGYTLQTYLLMDGVRWDRPLGVWLAQHRWPCVALSAGALLFEATFFIILFERFRIVRAVRPLYLAGGLLMHWGIFVLQAAPFWPLMALYSLWVPWERVVARCAALWRSHKANIPDEPASAYTPATAPAVVEGADDVAS